MAKADSTSWKCKMLFSEATRDLAHSAVKRKGVFSPLKVFPAPPKPAGQEAVSGMRECLELFGHNLCNEGERIKCDMEATFFLFPRSRPPLAAQVMARAISIGFLLLPAPGNIFSHSFETLPPPIS